MLGEKTIPATNVNKLTVVLKIKLKLSFREAIQIDPFTFKESAIVQ